MTTVITGGLVLDMSDWIYPSLAPEYLRGSGLANGVLKMQSSRDYNSFAGVPTPSIQALYLELGGTGWGEYDAKGVPHVGTVASAKIYGPDYFNVYLEDINLSAEEFFALLGSPDKMKMFDVLFSGNDIINGSPGNRDFDFRVFGDNLLGGRGDDVINGNGGLDTIDGGAGNDVIRTTPLGTTASQAKINGGGGFDTWSFDRSTTGISVDLESGVSGGDIATGIERVVGSNQADKITGSSSANTLDGGSGDDLISGAAGNDAIYGGSGDNILDGGDGDDSIFGDEGKDQITGGAGDDVIYGQGGFDIINGNMGKDAIRGQDGNDWVVGGKDNDQLYGGAGDDIVYGNMGDDFCSGEAGADLVRGGQGDDYLEGGEGADWMSGDRGNDQISGGAGADTFNFFIGAGIDLITDFSVADGDRIRLEGVTSYTIVRASNGTHIQLNNDDVIHLDGVFPESLRPDSIFFG